MRSTMRPPADVSSTLGMRGGRRPAAFLAGAAFFAGGFRSGDFLLDVGLAWVGLAGVGLAAAALSAGGLSAGAPDVALRPDGALEARRAGVGLPGPPRLPEPCDAPDSAMA